MIQIAPWKNRSNVPRCEPKNSTSVAPFDYFTIMSNVGSREISVLKPTDKRYDEKNKSCKERIVYKTIDSTIKHTSPTKEEIEQMNITTSDRPIDVKRYISFKGI
jgi:hypothetical protein